jgi:hypothetical protein
MSSTKEVHGGRVTPITFYEEDGITISESWMEVAFQDGNRMKLEEVAVQTWQEGQIIRSSVIIFCLIYHAFINIIYQKSGVL